jgi:hypothetical protein
MPRVRFEPTIPASKLAKIVHVLDHSATVTGELLSYSYLINELVNSLVRQSVTELFS